MTCKNQDQKVIRSLFIDDNYRKITFFVPIKIAFYSIRVVSLTNLSLVMFNNKFTCAIFGYSQPEIRMFSQPLRERISVNVS